MLDAVARVLVVDDDPFTRSLLKTSLAALGCSVSGEAATAADAMRAFRAEPADVVLADLDLGEGPTGMDLAHALRRLNASVGIVILSTYAEPRFMGHNQPPLPEGSVYLVKSTIADSEVLLKAIELARDPHAADALPDGNGSSMRQIVEHLSDQQIAIIRLVAAGLSNVEIARRLWVTEGTVEKTIARLIKQLDIKADKAKNQRVMIAQIYHQATGAVSVRGLTR